MGWFSGLFGSDEQRLKQGMKAANDGKPDVAIQKYDAILFSTKDGDLKARCLLNRALAYSALGDFSRAEGDLKLVLNEIGASAAVQSTAREKLARLQKRTEKAKSRNVCES